MLNFILNKAFIELILIQLTFIFDKVKLSSITFLYLLTHPKCPERGDKIRFVFSTKASPLN